PNTTSPVKNQERSRWLKERWKGGEKGSDMKVSARWAPRRMAARVRPCKANAKRFAPASSGASANKRKQTRVNASQFTGFYSRLF
ncbi:MAG TPA: hypothetical protein VE267_15115, partial [Bradyrhizobium sp.]|nr:hypothetical protein [Bradyrhizobium sp.]